MAAHLCVGFHASTVMQESADSCDSMQREGVPPCTSQCEDAALNLDQWPSVAFVAPFAPVFVAVIDVRDEGAAAPAYREPSLLHTTSPPLTIRNCCFRN